VLSAAPAWFADNVIEIMLGTLAVLTFFVVRMIQKVALRTTLLGLIVLGAVVAYANRVELERCARTCECSLAGRHVTVPTCQTDLDR